MRLFEITGDNENIVYNKLRDIYLIMNEYSKIPRKSTELEILHREFVGKLNEDPINLNYWIISSNRIAQIYSEIKKVI